MSRLALVLSTCMALAFSVSALAQDRSAELDKAVEEARAAYLALQDAEKRRNQGIESEAGERQGTAAGGGSRPNDQYFGRQAQLEHEVELARRRYEAAQKRWNELK
jgi:outer membrane lipoprotein-sorting protein